MWEVKSLAELEEVGVLKLGRGKIISKKDLAASPGDFPVYSSSKVGDGKFGEYGLYIFDEELITWSIDGGGRLFHRKKHKFSITNVTGFLRILDASVFSYKYLYYALSLLHSKINFDWVKKAHPSVLRKEYKHIPVPPLAEQQRIVAKLDAALVEIDEAISSSQPPLLRLREVLFDKSVFSSDATSRWEKTEVKNVLHPSKGSMRTGPFGSQLLKSELVSDGIRVLGIDNVVSNHFRWGKERFITEEKYKQLAKYQVKSGDVLITIMGTCGRCAVVPSDIPTAINTKHLCCMTLDTTRCRPEFLRLWFLYAPEALNHLYAEAKGAVMPGLNMGIIKNLPLSIPPVEKQLEIVTKAEHFFAEIDKTEKLYKKKRSELSALKLAILNQELQSKGAA